MHDTGCLGLVHWDDPEGWYGEGGGRRVQDGENKIVSALMFLTMIFILLLFFQIKSDLYLNVFVLKQPLPESNNE